MVDPIKTECFDLDRLERQSGDIATVPLLPGEMSGLTMHIVLLKPGVRYEAVPVQCSERICFFIRGEGTVAVGSQRFDISEMAIFCPAGRTYSVQCSDMSSIFFLEIQIPLFPEDQKQIEGYGERASWFSLYSQCQTYRDPYKSPDTISRTLVPPHIVPRFCMGSVQARGPDEVRAHCHPMLDQMFVGLPGNACTVFADGREAQLGANTVLHVPLGSEHGVQVEPEKQLHYLWIDLFHDGSDMSYIDDSHTPGEF